MCKRDVFEVVLIDEGWGKVMGGPLFDSELAAEAEAARLNRQDEENGEFEEGVHWVVRLYDSPPLRSTSSMAV